MGLELECARPRGASRSLRGERGSSVAAHRRDSRRRQGIGGRDAELREYWRKALDVAKELHFDISDVLIGSDAITVLYRNHRVLVFDSDLKVIEGIVTSK